LWREPFEKEAAHFHEFAPTTERRVIKRTARLRHKVMRKSAKPSAASEPSSSGVPVSAMLPAIFEAMV
jgi:hypothetical protein